MAVLKEQLEQATSEHGDEGKILKEQIRTQQTKIAELKVNIQEQRTLMMKMDLGRVQEMGVQRHAKKAERERMIDFAQDVVEEHKLVPVKKCADGGVQTEQEGAGMTVAEERRQEKEERDREREARLDTWKVRPQRKEALSNSESREMKLSFAPHM